MIRDVDLVSYLPPFIADYKETNITLTAEEPEFELVWKAADQAMKNEFIATADEYGIARFEKILRILPENSDSLEDRRVRIRNRWFNAVPYTIRMLVEKMIVLLGGARFFSIQADIEKAYELQLTIYSTEDIMFNGRYVKETKYLLAGMIPMNIRYRLNEKISLDISAGNTEQIVLRNVRFKMGIPFWYDLVFDGSWLLDGSVILNSKRRYGLVLGISHKLLIAGCTEEIRMHNLSARWEQHTPENIAAKVGVHLEAEPLAGKHEKVAFMVHSEIKFSDETVENVSVETKTPDYWFFNGEVLLDGAKNLNSIYKKEEI